MSVWIIIPTKPFAEGKTRLDSVLDRDSRERLNRQLYQHTLECALEVYPPDRIVVVSRSVEARQIARMRQVHTVRESGDALNEAVAQATDYSLRAGATGILSLSCDLPFLVPQDLLAMLGVDERPSAFLAPDRSGKGTNALTISPAEKFAWQFGTNSFRLHLAEAHRLGAAVRTIATEGLAFDLDTPVDFQDWKAKRV
ncbi:MAG TPA: 2-phospho-L-lactate guanylyltransferase [Rhizomicrobium sp.]|nr:2-phospho-L-lactate guanylyltransferase [Rhizomicrobium sp.]